MADLRMVNHASAQDQFLAVRDYSSSSDESSDSSRVESRMRKRLDDEDYDTRRSYATLQRPPRRPSRASSIGQQIAQETTEDIPPPPPAYEVSPIPYTSYFNPYSQRNRSLQAIKALPPRTGVSVWMEALRRYPSSPRMEVDRGDDISRPGIDSPRTMDSDEELEQRALEIRSEIRQSEMLELAIEAERAAEAGLEKFAGRACTFGDDAKVEDQSAVLKPKKLRRNRTFSEGASSLLKPSLLRYQSERKIRVMTLRHVSEVIPLFGEMHVHLRAHLARSGVNENTLMSSEMVTEADYERQGLAFGATSAAFIGNLTNWVSATTAQEGSEARKSPDNRAVSSVTSAINSLHNDMSQTLRLVKDDDQENISVSSSASYDVGGTLADHLRTTPPRTEKRKPIPHRMPQGWLFLDCANPDLKHLPGSSFFLSGRKNKETIGAELTSASSFEPLRPRQTREISDESSPPPVQMMMTPISLFDANDDDYSDADGGTVNSIVPPTPTGNRNGDDPSSPQLFETPVHLRGIRNESILHVSSRQHRDNRELGRTNNALEDEQGQGQPMEHKQMPLPFLNVEVESDMHNVAVDQQVDTGSVSERPIAPISGDAVVRHLRPRSEIVRHVTERVTVLELSSSQLNEMPSLEGASSSTHDQHDVGERESSDQLELFDSVQQIQESDSPHESTNGKDRPKEDFLHEEEPVPVDIVTFTDEQRQDDALEEAGDSHLAISLERGYDQQRNENVTETLPVIQADKKYDSMDMSLQADSGDIRVNPTDLPVTTEPKLLSITDVCIDESECDAVRLQCECIIPAASSLDSGPDLHRVDNVSSRTRLRRATSWPVLQDVVQGPANPRVVSPPTVSGGRESSPHQRGKRLRGKQNKTLTAAIDMLKRLSPKSDTGADNGLAADDLLVSPRENHAFLHNYLYCSKVPGPTLPEIQNPQNCCSQPCGHLGIDFGCDIVSKVIDKAVGIIPKRPTSGKELLPLNPGYTQLETDTWFDIATERFDGALETLVGSAPDTSRWNALFQAPKLKVKKDDNRVTTPKPSRKVKGVILVKQASKDDRLRENPFHSYDHPMSDMEFQFMYNMTREEFSALPVTDRTRLHDEIRQKRGRWMAAPSRSSDSCDEARSVNRGVTASDLGMALLHNG